MSGALLLMSPARVNNNTPDEVYRLEMLVGKTASAQVECVPCLLAYPILLDYNNMDFASSKIISDVQRCRTSLQHKSNTAGSVASSTTLCRMIFELMDLCA